jgi:predicted nucleotidyltransferase
MVDQSVAIKIAKDFVKDCKLSGLKFDKVLLFGSFAKGTVHEGSDIDLLLVSNQFTDNVFENLKLYVKVNIRYPIIETHPFSETLFQKEDEFIQSIIKNCIEII